MRRLVIAGTACLAAAYAAAPASAALTFNFTSTGNPNADAGFAAAGQRWSSIFNDNITVNITAGFGPLDDGVIAEASSSRVAVGYSTVRNSLAGDATTPNDATAVANLPAGPNINFFTHDRAGTRYLDNNNTANNGALAVNRANAKALQLVPANDPASDASIAFSSDLPFDFNPDDGITPGRFDFVATAAHEIGHALGFVSGVDTVDFYSAPSGPGRTDPIGSLEGYAVFSVLDLYRYSTSSIAAGSDILDLAYGGTPFFSTDGSTNMGPFSTGAFNGDGQQASHWKDDLGLGLLDPTLAPGERGVITENDRRALDVVGYNLVPEPSSLALVGAGGLLMLRRRRRA